jgi:hypothetical protein
MMPNTSRFCKDVLNLEDGIVVPDHEIFTTDRLPNGITHNKVSHNAHHDILIPVHKNGRIINIAISAKSTFRFPAKGDVVKQVLSKKKKSKDDFSAKPVEILVWLFLGNGENLAEMYPQVASISGSGSCNGLIYDQYSMLKIMKSQNNAGL